MQEQPGRFGFGVVTGGAKARLDTPGGPPVPLGREAIDMLAEVPLFAALSRRHLGKIANAASAKRYSPGAALVREGGPANAFYVIFDGRARVDTPKGGIELGAGEFFGEMALLDGEPRSATVVAVSEVYVMAISRPKFLAVLEAEPKIALAIMTTLSRRLRALQGAATP
jgi:CRP/FNR family transcriptional regulator, cyclic AMP receptor protein